MQAIIGICEVDTVKGGLIMGILVYFIKILRHFMLVNKNVNVNVNFIYVKNMAKNRKGIISQSKSY